MTRKPQPTQRADLPTDAIRRRLANHTRSCKHYLFSSDRACTCGRDLALTQLQALEAAAHKGEE